jgi:type VI secretion system protein ImpE
VAGITFEPPTDLRDMVWAPVAIEFPNGGGTVALVPTRYAPMPEGTEASLRLSRGTDWLEISPGQYRGVGQRVLTTDQAELGLLDVRTLTLDVAADLGAEPDAAEPPASGEASA